MRADQEDDWKLSQENEGRLGRVRNFALQHVTYEPFQRVVAQVLYRVETVALSLHQIS